MAKSGTTSGQLDICQPLGQADLQSDIPSVEASGGQESYPQVNLTFGQPLGHADLQSDVPPTRGI